MAEKSTKAPNFTAEQTQELRAAYVANATDYESGQRVVAEFADKFGKPEKSIRAKLVREGVYIPKTYVTKNGEAPVGKEDLADQIGSMIGLSEPETDSLSKANKTALLAVLRALQDAQAAVESASLEPETVSGE